MTNADVMERMERTENEIWRPVVGYEGFYEVSDLGRVRCVTRRGKPITPQILRQHDLRGYRIIALHRDGSQKTKRVHRLVAEAFIPNPCRLPQINHIDGNKSNNSVSNLEWVDASGNVNHAIRTGLMNLDVFSGTILHKENLHEVVGLRRLGLSCEEIGEMYGVHHATVHLRIKRKTYLMYFSEEEFEAKVADFMEKNKDKYRRRDGRVLSPDGTPTKPIIQIDKNGNVVGRFKSIAEAALANKMLPSSISNNLIGLSKSCGGFKYVYERRD